MSETEHLKGRLTPVYDKTAEQICKEYYGRTELNNYYETWEEMLQDIGYREEYQILNGQLYKVELVHYEDSDSIFEGVLNEDGSIEVDCKFYNGGCGLAEALEYCIENALNNE